MLIKQELIQQIHSIIATAKDKAIRSIIDERMLMYRGIGKVIFEEQQQRKIGLNMIIFDQICFRYFSANIKNWIFNQLFERYRQFYHTIPITSAMRMQFSCTHYKNLTSIDNQDKRAFYIAEASKIIVCKTVAKANKQLIIRKHNLYLHTEQQLLDEIKKYIDKLDNSTEY